MVQPPPTPIPVSIEVTPPEVVVAPGVDGVLTLTLRNLSEAPQTQSLGVEGVPASWISTDFDSARQTFPGETRGATVTIHLPEDVPAGSLPLRVLVRVGEMRAFASASLRVLQDAATGPDAGARPPGLSLSQSNVTIETGSDQSVSVVVTLRNVEPSESSYELALRGLPESWFELMRNVRVQAFGIIDVPLAVRVPAGAASGVYPFVVSATTGGTVAEATGSITLLARSATARAAAELVERPQVGVTPPEVGLQPDRFELVSGEAVAQATLSVHNPTGLLERYKLDLRGLPDAWHDLFENEITVEPGGTRQVLIRLAPRLSAAHPAGAYSGAIRVTPLSAPGAFAERGMDVEVEGRQSFDARVTPQQLRGRNEMFKVTLHNNGTLPFTPWVECVDPAGLCTFQLEPPPTLAAGEERVVRVKVRVRRNRFVGSPRPIDFSVKVQPAGAGASAARGFEARLVHEPMLSMRHFRWAARGALVFILVLVLLRLGGDESLWATGNPNYLMRGVDWTRCLFSAQSSCVIGAAANAAESKTALQTDSFSDLGPPLVHNHNPLGQRRRLGNSTVRGT